MTHASFINVFLKKMAVFDLLALIPGNLFNTVFLHDTKNGFCARVYTVSIHTHE